ncbi:MAG: hypothetical protein HS111_20995 [Kofleriaceae bacterium]|nr:hypothetical protein [Kofleriaceae bacterium]
MSKSNPKTIASDSPFCEADATMDRIKDRLTSPEAMRMTLSEIERLVGTEGHELLRELVQAHVDLRAAQEQAVEVVGADGVARTQVRKSSTHRRDAARRGHGDAEPVPGRGDRGAGAARRGAGAAC